MTLSLAKSRRYNAILLLLTLRGRFGNGRRRRGFRGLVEKAPQFPFGLPESVQGRGHVVDALGLIQVGEAVLDGLEPCFEGGHVTALALEVLCGQTGLDGDGSNRFATFL